MAYSIDSIDKHRKKNTQYSSGSMFVVVVDDFYQQKKNKKQQQQKWKKNTAPYIITGRIATKKKLERQLKTTITKLNNLKKKVKDFFLVGEWRIF